MANSAMLGTHFLKEELGVLGKLGCAICLIGSVIIVLHAPPDKEIGTIDQILYYAIQPGAIPRLLAPQNYLLPVHASDQCIFGWIGFLAYCVFVCIFSSVMIYKVSPKYGKKNPLIYISICGTVGSLTVMSSKAFGIAVKLSFAGGEDANQFTHPSTYVFVIVVGVCILTQMNYFNKALTQFSSSLYALCTSLSNRCNMGLTSGML